MYPEINFFYRYWIFQSPKEKEIAEEWRKARKANKKRKKQKQQLKTKHKIPNTKNVKYSEKDNNQREK